MNCEALTQAALGAGAAKAVVIEQKQIVLSETFFDNCKSNQCGFYNRCWMCPPDTGDIHDLMAALRGYPHALLYQTIGALEDSFDIEGMQAAARVHAGVGQKLRAALDPLLVGNRLHLTCGGCRLCETCAKRDDLPCRHPREAMPSLESYGVDVYNTTKDTPLRYINGQNTVTYFGMVAFMEAQ